MEDLSPLLAEELQIIQPNQNCMWRQTPVENTFEPATNADPFLHLENQANKLQTKTALATELSQNQRLLPNEPALNTGRMLSWSLTWNKGIGCFAKGDSSDGELTWRAQFGASPYSTCLLGTIMISNFRQTLPWLSPKRILIILGDRVDPMACCRGFYLLILIRTLAGTQNPTICRGISLALLGPFVPF